jgi:hypothetical protein
MWGAFEPLKNFFISCPENNCRPKFLFSSFLFWLSLVILALHVLPIFFFTFFQNDPLFGDITRTSIVALTNQERAGLNLGELKISPALEEAARLKAKDMFANGYFAHESPKGISPWHWFGVAGYDYEYAGENLAIGFLEPEEVYSGWVHSFTHHQNLLNPNFKEIGVAVVSGKFNGNHTTIVVQLFGSQKYVAKAPLATIPPKPSPVVKKEIPKSDTVANVPAKTLEPVAVEPVVAIPVQTQEVAGRELARVDKSVLLSAKEAVLEKPSLKAQFYSFLIFQYNDVLRLLTFWTLIAICSILLISMSFAPEVRRPETMFKAFFFLGVLLLFAVSDKKTLIELIPHSFMIQ